MRFEPFIRGFVSLLENFCGDGFDCVEDLLHLTQHLMVIIIVKIEILRGPFQQLTAAGKVNGGEWGSNR